MRLTGLWALAALVAAAPALAETRYECTFPEMRVNGGWIPTFVVVQDRGEAGIIVFDTVIREFGGVPIAAERGDETRARTTYKWTVRARSRSGQVTPMSYRLTIYRNGLPASIVAEPAGYRDRFTAEGDCRTKAG
jgi:hypothetical protein